MKKCLLSISLLFLSTIMMGQIERTSALFKTLNSLDSLLFNIGFNTCDISQFENLLSEDFEFYHDKGGITNNKPEFVASIANGLCKLHYQPVRKLDENSLSVFPLKKEGVLYGAIQTGVHRFYAIETDKAEYFTSIAKFTSVWLLENEVWKLSRVLSYDHQEEDTAVDESLLFIDEQETERWLEQEGVATLVFMIPATKKALIIFTNTDDGYKVFVKIIAHYLGAIGRAIIKAETGE